jgi:hypothetical protein
MDYFKDFEKFGTEQNSNINRPISELENIKLADSFEFKILNYLPNFLRLIWDLIDQLLRKLI